MPQMHQNPHLFHLDSKGIERHLHLPHPAGPSNPRGCIESPHLLHQPRLHHLHHLHRRMQQNLSVRRIDRRRFRYLHLHLPRVEFY